MEYNGVLLKWQQCKYPKIISMPDKASSKSVILVINSQFKKNTWTTWNLSPFILNNAVYSKCSNRDPTGWEVTLFSFLFLFLSLNQSITTLFFYDLEKCGLGCIILILAYQEACPPYLWNAIFHSINEDEAIPSFM